MPDRPKATGAHPRRSGPVTGTDWRNAKRQNVTHPCPGVGLFLCRVSVLHHGWDCAPGMGFPAGPQDLPGLPIGPARSILRRACQPEDIALSHRLAQAGFARSARPQSGTLPFRWASACEQQPAKRRPGRKAKRHCSDHPPTGGHPPGLGWHRQRLGPVGIGRARAAPCPHARQTGHAGPVTRQMILLPSLHHRRPFQPASPRS